MNVAEILRHQVEQRPDAIALIDVHRGRTRRLTFTELEQAAGRMAMLLQQAGLKAGDTVLVLQPMSAELYIVLAALFRGGLIAMFLDPAAGPTHLQRCCEIQPPRAVIASSRAHLLRLVSSALRRIPRKFVIGGWVPGAIQLPCFGRQEYLDTIQPCLADTPALLTFTSGNTGEPKAALRTHGFLLAQHRALEKAMESRAGEVELCTQPIFILANMASGVTSVIPDADLRRPGAVHPAPIVAQIATQQATRAAASPAFYERLIHYCDQNNITLSSLTKIFTGGAPVWPNLVDQLRRIAPHATVTTVYGSTEAEPIACVAHHQITPKDVSAMRSGQGLLAGNPVPTIRVRILENRWGTPIGPLTVAEFEAASAPTGGPGEIVVSGAHVLSGYLRGNGDQDNKFDVAGVRWHRTGDAGYLDHLGRLWLLGRCSARIADQHGTVYPLNVEPAALQHASVRRAAVIALDGRRVLAVELHNGRRSESLATSLLKSVQFAGVHQVRVVKQMPVDVRHNSKIDYTALRVLLEKSE